jgi:hypothetical protein
MPKANKTTDPSLLDSHCTPVDETTAIALREIYDERGPYPAARAIGISGETLARAIARLPLSAITHARIHKFLNGGVTR